MAVQVQGDRHTRMSQPFADYLRIYPLLHHQSCMSVPEIMAYAEAVGEQLTRSEPKRVSKRGPQPQKDSLRSVSEQTGIPASTLSKSQTHVTTADAFPFMKAWPQYRVIYYRTPVIMTYCSTRANTRRRNNYSGSRSNSLRGFVWRSPRLIGEEGFLRVSTSLTC